MNSIISAIGYTAALIVVFYEVKALSSAALWAYFWPSNVRRMKDGALVANGHAPLTNAERSQMFVRRWLTSSLMLHEAYMCRTQQKPMFYISPALLFSISSFGLMLMLGMTAPNAVALGVTGLVVMFVSSQVREFLHALDFTDYCLGTLADARKLATVTA
ncbi:hypothetical protein [Rhizobacter sp. Root404]|uniref:hypothetical protein n=1 Tax=Rhizobacter sp. Root404 TaxID=1736528 RepID=UPI0006F6932E|nr:hypothetical protein [Rhizobacter sp. Root404]KQW36767.1 hypothetical protein ASC76_19210 [Rhizobacter sp. Root404]